ncbi:hypothetical protein DAEQUDRAFT_814248 [Daedalea quercina L-15889]|uniref:Uncharacterized protein n=1 Tax=Daedalea quercina L-15889 TaxID=1314783 RepID=A0A165MAX9_9APHY|nr:hypothetical protein DAEQUDRAFT_814248 [Daedalea quercina L-15889]
MALSFGTGGAYEVLSMLLYVFAALIVFMRMIHMFRVDDQGSRGCLIMDGFVWSLGLMGCLILTVRAARNSGLVQDYSALTDARSAAAAVLTLSWLGFSLASLGITLDLFQPHRPADVTPFTPFTNPPPRHRVVFHENHRPLKIIEIPRDTKPYTWTQQTSTGKNPSYKEQYPRAPKPAHARPTQKHPETYVNLRIHLITA